MNEKQSAVDSHAGLQPLLLTVRDTADMLRLSLNAVYKLCQTGLPHLRVGSSIRIDPNELDQFLAECRVVRAVTRKAAQKRYRKLKHLSL